MTFQLVWVKVVIAIMMVCLPVMSSLPAQAAKSITAAAPQTPILSGCPVFPENNIWNYPAAHLPVHPRSANYIQSIGPSTGLHPDFGAGLWDGGPIGIPYNIVTSTQAKVPVDFDYAGESDAGPYPIPANPIIEGGSGSTGDRHILIVDTDACMLYELYYAFPPSGSGSWQAGSGAIFNLRSNALRPNTWTSADAAGLPILAGLARYDEVAAGHIDHALRFTVSTSQRAYVWPARHYASSNTSLNVPPMGMRFRLKASFDTSHFKPQSRVILEALKEYGMIVADNGSNWYISGVPDERWDNDDLRELRQVTGNNFEAVDQSVSNVLADSGAVTWKAGIPILWIPLVKK